ncbi:MAG: ABC transporter ATP-binding protein/permease [Treponema sp.]|jgi:ATP-binding cassette subfamily B protein|nr:ABC transporter ATP-binding protein/permease [Treponema sp.]
MIRILKNITAGEPRKIIGAVLWTLFAYLFNMFPMVCVTMAVNMIYEYFSGAALNAARLWIAWGVMAIFFFLVFWGEKRACRASYYRGYEISADGRTKLAEHIRKLPLGFLTGKEGGGLGNAMMTDFFHIEEAITHVLPQVLSGALTAIIAFMGLCAIDWRMALAAFAGLPVTILIIWTVRRLEHKLGTSNIRARVELSNRFQEYLTGMTVIKSCNLRGANFTKLEKACRQFMKECIKLEGGMGPFYLVAVGFLQTGLSMITIVGVYLLLGGEINIPVFALFLFVGTRVFDSFAVAITKLPQFRFYAAGGGRIMHILEQPVMAGEAETPTAHNIRLDNVRFGYGKTPVLDNVSVEMREGTMTAIVGPSGSGKTTLLRLIARFYDPQSGMILFGGEDERRMDPEKLMKNISFVFQDVYLFQDTIAGNIRYGRENASQEEIESAAKEASCHDFIMKFPNGYNTHVGEGGSTLSGGEKQRISIARAILKNAPVILLDEATSSLDPENEAEVQGAISRLIQGRTVIMIAHRLRTVVKADNIIVLDKGKVAEQGTHDDLLHKGGLYAKLWDLQQKTSGWKITA